MKTLIEELKATNKSLTESLEFFQERKAHYEAVNMDGMPDYYEGKIELARDVIRRLSGLIEYHEE